MLRASMLTCAKLAALATIIELAAFSPADANIFTNPGFETVPNGATGQGLMPSDWFATSSTPDTYSNDGSYGLFPSDFGNFPGVTAHGGIRWVAGGSPPFFAENFAQNLSTSLAGGQSYILSGWLHQALRPDLDRPGGYDVFLTDGLTSEFLAHLGDTPNDLDWNFFSAAFIAPANAASLGEIEFRPTGSVGGSAYPGLDDVDLHANIAAVSEPATLAAICTSLACFSVLALRQRRRPSRDSVE